MRQLVDRDGVVRLARTYNPYGDLYEVFKRLIGQCGESAALVQIGDMHQGQIVDLTASIALQAAKISTELKIAMADSILLATARVYAATLWTQDADFEGIEGVQYIRKPQ